MRAKGWTVDTIEMAVGGAELLHDLAPAGDLPRLPPLSSEVGRNPPVAMTPEQLRQYAEDGYAFFPSLIDREITAELRCIVDEMVAHNIGDLSFEPSDPSLVQRITGPHRYSRAFAELTRNPALCGVVAQIIGPSFRHNNVKLNFKPPRVGSAVEWHQVCKVSASTGDGTYMSSSHRCCIAGLGILPTHQWGCAGGGDFS